RQLIRDAQLSQRGSDLQAGLAAGFAVGNLDAADTSESGAADAADPDAESAVTVTRRRDAWRHLVLVTDMQASGWSSFLRGTLLNTADNPLPVTVVDASGGETGNRFVRQVRFKQASAGS